MLIHLINCTSRYVPQTTINVYSSIDAFLERLDYILDGVLISSIGEETYAGEKITDEPTWIGMSTHSSYPI